MPAAIAVMSTHDVVRLAASATAPATAANSAPSSARDAICSIGPRSSNAEKASNATSAAARRKHLGMLRVRKLAVARIADDAVELRVVGEGSSSSANPSLTDAEADEARADRWRVHLGKDADRRIKALRVQLEQTESRRRTQEELSLIHI